MPSQEDDDKIHALPESSDDEEHATPETSNTSRGNASPKRKHETEDVDIVFKRVKRSTQPKRSSQRKTRVTQQNDATTSSSSSMITVPDAVLPNGLEDPSQSQKSRNPYKQKDASQVFGMPGTGLDIDQLWSSQPISSQSSQNRNRKTYGKINQYHVSQKQDVQNKNGLAIPDDIPIQHLATPKRARGKFVAIPKDSPASSITSPAGKLKQPSSEAEEPIQPTTKFFIPDEPALEYDSSSNPIDADQSLIFDDEIMINTRRSSSGGTSATTPHPFPEDLANNKPRPEPLPTGFVRCPICTQLVKEPPTKLAITKMSFRQQQDFCHTHKIHDAQTTWQERNYPTIDWVKFETERIPTHLPYLRKILYRKEESYYFDSLESNIKKARGNASKIRKYFLDGIMDVVKSGYYGPKGARIMSQIITENMHKQLKMQLKANKTVATAGVAGFVSAVLLPELCQQMVMEDMNLTDQVDARQVMSESDDLGMILYPDDDHVENADELQDGDD